MNLWLKLPTDEQQDTKSLKENWILLPKLLEKILSKFSDFLKDVLFIES